MTAGLVVAGGYSTRFGLREKALVPVGDEPMLRRIVRSLQAVVDDVVVDCRPGQVPAFERSLGRRSGDVRFVHEPTPDRGPVAGLAAGLTAVDDETVVVTACDRPGVTPAFLQGVLDRLSVPGTDAVVPSVGGFLQPLCGAYRTERLSVACDGTLAADERRLRRVVGTLDVRTVAADRLPGVPDARWLRSVDCPIDARAHPIAADRGGSGQWPDAEPLEADDSEPQPGGPEPSSPPRKTGASRSD